MNTKLIDKDLAKICKLILKNRKELLQELKKKFPHMIKQARKRWDCSGEDFTDETFWECSAADFLDC